MDKGKPIEDQGDEVQKVLDFYVDLMDNSKNLLRYYLSEDVVLDWFGQTVKSQKKVAAFVKTNIHPVKHIFHDAKPVTKIGFRDTHLIRTSRSSRRILRSAFLSPPRPTLMITPVKQPQASTSARRQIGRLNLDGVGKSPPPSPVKNGSDSPRKRQKMTPTSTDVGDIDLVESENDVSDLLRVKYLTAEGHVEFHRPSSKKLQKETKWQRPCKLHIAYDCSKDIKDSSFYLIIYEGNVKCRRNLMRDFEAEEPEN